MGTSRSGRAAQGSTELSFATPDAPEDPAEATTVEPRRRFYGRRKGPALSPRQKALLRDLLPHLRLDLERPAPVSLTGLFTPPVREIWLEIGFGGGEHLAWQAKDNPQAGLIGCEPYVNGVVKLLSAVADDGLGNVRIHPDDARQVLACLPDSSLARVFILYPDPWPKRRHRRRRIVNDELAGALARVMAPGAELRLATDIGDNARTMLASLSRRREFVWTAKGPADWRIRPDDWPQTRYEAKALASERRCYYFRFIRAVTGKTAGLSTAPQETGRLGAC